MARKAAELMSPDQLSLSERTRMYLDKSFDSVDTLVKSGRIIAFEHEEDASRIEHSLKWEQELASALKKAGFIRPAADFATTFRINALYAAVYVSYKEMFITSISQLSNREYENFQSLSDEEINKVKTALSDQLTKEQYAVICSRFGLLDNKPKSLAKVSQQLGIDGVRVRQMETRALKTLRYKVTADERPLPALLNVTQEIHNTVEELKGELYALHKSPAFRREREIVAELNHLQKAPFKHYDGGLFDFTPIDQIGLSVRAYVCLKRSNIDTVSDIIGLPSEKWLKIRNFGRLSAKDVVERVRAIGYKDFIIEGFGIEDDALTKN